MKKTYAVLGGGDLSDSTRRNTCLTVPIPQR